LPHYYTKIKIITGNIVWLVKMWSKLLFLFIRKM
jgi:hypothetical protein